MRRDLPVMKLPSRPKTLALLAAIFPVMDLRTRNSAAWIPITALSALFWGLLVLLGLGVWSWLS